MLPKLMLALLALGSNVIADRCGSIPPSLWCSNDDLVQECGFHESCQRYFTATRDKKVNLTVLVEALCPDCQRFIAKSLFPVIYKNFREFVKIQIVPFGNAHIQPDGSITCQHGPTECEINKFESCLINAYEDKDAYLPVVYCIETELEAKTEFADAVSKCFDSYNVTDDVQRLIQSCLVSNIGAQLQKDAAELTNNVWPEKHTFVPWIVFNGVSLTRMQSFQNEIPALICQWYNGEKAIPYCESALKKRFKAGSVRFNY